MPKKEMIGDFSIGHLLETAKAAVAKKTNNSTVLDREAEDRIPKFKESGRYTSSMHKTVEQRSLVIGGLAFVMLPI